MRPNRFTHDIGCPHECTERHNHPDPPSVARRASALVLAGLVKSAYGWGILTGVVVSALGRLGLAWLS